MADLKFQVFRWLVIAAGLTCVVNWLSLSHTLGVEQARHTAATVTYSQYKGRSFAHLHTRDLGEVQVSCVYAPRLCNKLAFPAGKIFDAWLQQPGLLSPTWIVAIELDGERIVEPEVQAALYRTDKIIWGAVSLFAALLVAMLLFAGPFQKTAEMNGRSSMLMP